MWKSNLSYSLTRVLFLWLKSSGGWEFYLFSIWTTTKKSKFWFGGQCVYQDQLALIGDLSGPRCLGPLPFLQSLLTADLTVSFPTWKTLRAKSERRRNHWTHSVNCWIYRLMDALCFERERETDESEANEVRRQERWSSATVRSVTDWPDEFALETTKKRPFIGKRGKQQWELRRDAGQENARRGKEWKRESWKGS